VWLLKQQPAFTSNSRRDFVISSTAFAILERHGLVKQKEEQLPDHCHHKYKQTSQCKSYLMYTLQQYSSTAVHNHSKKTVTLVLKSKTITMTEENGSTFQTRENSNT
jgi:hypothetical protein